MQKTDLADCHFIALEEQLKILIPESSEIAQLMKYLEPLELEEGELLFRQGDPPDGLYFLESGQVSVFLELSAGKTKRLRTYHSGTILGEIGLYGNAPRSAAVIADAPSYLCYLSSEAFSRIEKENSQLAAIFHKFIVNLLAERLKRREVKFIRSRFHRL